MTVSHETPGVLAELIAPHAPDKFFKSVFEVRALHAPGSAPDRFSSLISLEVIDALLAEGLFREGDLSMARAEPRLADGVWLREDGLVDRGEVARLYQQGATLILPQLQARHRPLADMCRQLEADFSCPVQTNIYLTPPNAQGFQTHYDNHDVLVLQVEGRKRWRLYDAPVGVPYRGERFTPGRFAQTEPREELVLEPGDVLYVPRGLMHDAVNEGDDQASLHITTGLLAKTWADFLLEAVSEAALRTPALRRALPPGYAKGAVSREHFDDAFQSALREVGQNADLDAVIHLFTDTAITSRPADTRGALTFGALSPQTRIKRRPLIALELTEEDDHLALVAPGGALTFDSEAEAGLERLLAGATISLSDFSAMDDAKARDVMERLIAYGAAERA
ncbi:cupin domain-containing protein [Oceanicaulis sp.]|uniref:cupin domain-containing protein n=1 Tax=Oceanicaulis sp. TaxID=1924941 RepID=UPI003BABB19D